MEKSAEYCGIRKRMLLGVLIEVMSSGWAAVFVTEIYLGSFIDIWATSLKCNKFETVWIHDINIDQNYVF